MDVLNDSYSLKWSDFRSDFTEGFRDLLKEETMVDVTLAVEGQVLQAHKLVLSVCSPYFKNLFKINPCNHPIVILKDVSYHILNYMLEFMYKGEVGVKQDDLSSFLNLAETLKVKGLAGEQSYRESTVLHRRRRVSRERKMKIPDLTSDSESDADLERKAHSRRQVKRRLKPNHKNAKKSKVKGNDGSAAKKFKVDEIGEEDDSADSDCSPLVKLIIGKPSTEGRLAPAAEESSGNNDDCDDTVNDDFDMPAAMFHSESTSETADQGLQGSWRRERTSRLWSWYHMDSDQLVTCLLCPSGKKFRFYTTGQLSRHLRSLHPEQYAEFKSQQGFQKTYQMTESALANISELLKNH